jgi:hypothetical protein
MRSVAKRANLLATPCGFWKTGTARCQTDRWGVRGRPFAHAARDPQRGPEVGFWEVQRLTQMNASRQTKVKPLSPYHRFVIAVHSPHGIFETGVLGCSLEKRLPKWPVTIKRTLSPVRFKSKNREIPLTSCNIRGHPGRFLCTADLLVALPGISRMLLTSCNNTGKNEACKGVRATR